MTDVTAPAADGPKSQPSGVALVFLATFAWSLSGVFTRLLTTDIWTAIAWRSFFGGLFLLVAYVIINKRRSLTRFMSVGWPGVLFVGCQVICQACTVGGLYLTSVANVTVIYATAPFIAAGLAWWLFGEKMQARTVIAAIVSVLGVVVIAAGSLGGGHFIGDLLAMGMTISFAFIIVIPRGRSDLPLLPTTILSAFATTAIFAPLSSPFTLDQTNWVILAGFGLTNFTIALFMFLVGSRRMPSAKAALIGTFEIVLAPLWVWLLFEERPTTAAFIGGTIIFGVVVWHTYRDMRDPAR